MKPARFAMERPRDLAAALAMIAGADGTTKIIAGGQSLGPMLNLRLIEPDRVIDISAVRSCGGSTARTARSSSAPA